LDPAWTLKILFIGGKFEWKDLGLGFVGKREGGADYAI
jgi:hypothetical protein